MKHYLKVNGTSYTLASLDRVSAMQALASKITGKHRPVKSKGAEKRFYPRFGAGMTTAAYVAKYYALNNNLNIKGSYDALSGRVSVPEGVDSVEICS